MLARQGFSTKTARGGSPIIRAIAALAARGRATLRNARSVATRRREQAALAEWDGRASAESVADRLDRIKRESWLHLQMRTGFRG